MEEAIGGQMGVMRVVYKTPVFLDRQNRLVGKHRWCNSTWVWWRGFFFCWTAL